ncbi:MAG: hypothetical protein Kow00121_39810 [Elainellaceae cyanobacterium]
MQRLLLAGLCVMAMAVTTIPADTLSDRFEEVYQQTVSLLADRFEGASATKP